LQLIQGQEQPLIVEEKVTINATATTSFSLSVRDSIDKDYESVGSLVANTEIQSLMKGNDKLYTNEFTPVIP